MARVVILSDAAIIDTSWLLELYRVPGHYKECRTTSVKATTGELAEAECELFVTLPVLFELANHIAHVGDGNCRYALAEMLLNDIRNAVDNDFPWTIATMSSGILLRSRDVVDLAKRFLTLSGPGYSLADISVIDLAEELRGRSKQVRILEFDKQLKAYSD